MSAYIQSASEGSPKQKSKNEYHGHLETAKAPQKSECNLPAHCVENFLLSIAMSDVLTHNDSPPVLPIPPGDDECCRSGCDPCVFDLHAQAMERYRAELQTWEERQKNRQKEPGTTR